MNLLPEMVSLQQRCFVDEITEPVGFFEVKRPSSNGDDENAAPDVEQFFTGFRDLGRRLDSAGEDYTYRYMCVSASHAE